MPAGHHRKTTPWALRRRRLRKPAGFALALATAFPITASAHMTTADERVLSTAAPSAGGVVRTDMRTASRSRDRLIPPVPRPVKAADSAVRLRLRWTTTRLNIWSGPREGSRLLTVLDTGAKVRVTGKARGTLAEIVWRDRSAWVRKAYLARTKPTATATVTASTAGVSGKPCPDGSAVEVGLQPNTVKLYRAVCAAFPAVTAWGGRSGSGGDHGAGKALDIMSTGSLRDAIADYVRAHASAFGVSYVIRAQRIWSVERSSEGWRLMEDRGSATANHFDHVHVSLY